MGLILYAAIDGGGTKTIAAIYDARGRRLGEARSGPANQHYESLPEVGRRLQDAVRGACREAGVRPNSLKAVGAGLAGVGLSRPTPNWFRRLWPVPSRAVWDAVAAYYGAFGRAFTTKTRRHEGHEENLYSSSCSSCLRAFVVNCQPGAVILAGTGSAVYARGADGLEARVGGWGPLVVSEWGADRIARDAITAAVEAGDGRLAASPLTRRVRRRLGLPDVARFVAVTREISRPDLASLAAVVGRAAASGDPVAVRILRRSAMEMARAVRAALARVGRLGGPVKVSYAGSVFRSGPAVMEPLAGFLAEFCPGARLTAPRRDPVYGAYLIAMEAAGRRPAFQRKGAEAPRRN